MPPDRAPVDPLDPAVEPAARFMEAVGAAPRHTRTTAPRQALRAPLDALRTLALLRSLPSEQLDLRGPGASRYLEHCSTRTPHTRSWFVAQAVLRIPEDIGDYTRGRSRQAMRTNMRRARNEGYEVRMLGDHDPEILVVAGLFRGDECLTYATCCMAGRWAYLEHFKNLAGPTSHARYLLHHFIVEALHERGIRRLHAGSALTPRSQRYLLHLEGYEAMNLRRID